MKQIGETGKDLKNKHQAQVAVLSGKIINVFNIDQGLSTRIRWHAKSNVGSYEKMSKNFMIKVYADYQENHKQFDDKEKFFDRKNRWY